jgi:hypothetical protein
VNILRSLSIILSKNSSVSQVILKHNDQKTVKFIFRNVFSLLALHISDETKELSMNFAFSNARETSVIAFFVHILLNNYGTTGVTQAVKRDLINIFIRQVSKSLVFQPPSDSVWAVSSALLQKFSSIWLIARFLTMRPFESNSKDAAGAITQKKEKYYRL